MKVLIKVFYNILLNCEKYGSLEIQKKTDLLDRYLSLRNHDEKHKLNELTKYFDKYQSFCFDLSINSVIKGDLNFEY